MRLAEHHRRAVHTTVILACAIGFTAALSAAYWANEHQLPRREKPLAASMLLLLVGFIVAADRKQKWPWLELCAAAAAAGWLILVFTVALVR